MLHTELRIQQQALQSEQTPGFAEGVLKVTEKIILIIWNIIVYSVLLLLEHWVEKNQSFIHSFIPLSCADCDEYLPFSGASSIPLCYVIFPATLLHQLFYHPLSPHIAIYFLVYPSILLFPNSYILPFWEFYFSSILCTCPNEHNLFNLTYLLTPRCRVLLEKLTGLQLVKKFSAFHGAWRFITALTSVCHLSLSWASPIQSIHPHPTSWRSILILSTHLRLGLPSGLFPSLLSLL